MEHMKEHKLSSMQPREIRASCSFLDNFEKAYDISSADKSTKLGEFSHCLLLTSHCLSLMFHCLSLMTRTFLAILLSSGAFFNADYSGMPLWWCGSQSSARFCEMWRVR